MGRIGKLFNKHLIFFITFAILFTSLPVHGANPIQEVGTNIENSSNEVTVTEHVYGRNISPINIKVRIEGFEKNLVPFQDLQVEPFDISHVYNIDRNSDPGRWFEENDEPLVIHGIVKALEREGYDLEDSGETEVWSNGNYIAGIAGEFEFDRGNGSGWMYRINGKLPPIGVGQKVLKENDILEMYYIANYTDYYFTTLTSSRAQTNEGEEIIFTLEGIKGEWGDEGDPIPIANADIYINGKKSDFKTDENGQSFITFDKKGIYTIGAEKREEVGQNEWVNIIRPIPVTILVSEGKVNEDQGDRIQLKKKIEEAKEYKRDQYTPESYEHLKKAIEEGEKALQKEKITSKEVDKLLAFLTKATEGLIKQEEQNASNINQVIQKAVNWILSKNQLTEWDIIGVSKSGAKVPEHHYEELEEFVVDRKGNFRKVTDYERIALAVISLGKDPKNIAGYDFIEKIYNNERMINQGTNGPVFALIALDSRNYEIEEGARWNRDQLIKWILNQQNEDGGFPLAKGQSSDIDITAMTLQALSNYQHQSKVKIATDKAINYLSDQQLDDGGYFAWGNNNSESIAQTIIALTSLGIDPNKDTRFVKNENSLVQKLLTFVNEDGGIAHVKGQESNGMATEQGLIALVAYDRYSKGERGLIYQDAKEDPISDKPNKEELIEKVKEAKKYDKNEYTEESFQSLEKAIKQGEEILSNEDATKEEIETIVALLEEIIDKLIKKDNEDHIIIHPDSNGLTDIYIQDIYSGTVTLEIKDSKPIKKLNVDMTSIDNEVILHINNNHFSIPEIYVKTRDVELIIPESQVLSHPWDKKIILPRKIIYEEEIEKQIKQTLKKENLILKDIEKAIKVGGNKEIEFSYPVKIVFKGESGKEAGYFNGNKFNRIKKLENKENIQGLKDWCYDQGKDLIVETTHFTEFIIYTLEKEGSGNSNLPVDPKKDSIILSIEKLSLGKGYILEPTKVPIKKRDTAYTVLQKVGNERGIEIDRRGYHETLYVEAIDGLGEFDEGPLSGWMYSVNDWFPNYSAGIYYLKDGDVLRWQYTTNLGKDIGGDYAMGSEAKKGLKEEIEKAERLKEEEYTQETWQQLQEKLVHAKKIYNKSGGTNEEIILAWRELSNAIKSLVRENRQSSKTIDKSMLEQKIREAEKIDKKAYVEQSYKILMEALEEAKRIHSLTNPSEEEICLAYEGLEKAIEMLIKKDEKIDENIERTIENLSQWILEKEELSEWDVLALSRLGKKIPEQYYINLEKYIREKEGSFRKVTDYERIALAVASMEKDPQNIGGYNFIEKIYNNDRMTMQGTNGPVFALIALDSKGYEVPHGVEWNRDQLIDWILDQQNDDGGFPLTKGETSDIDITAMTLQGLSNYVDHQRVKESIDKGVHYLSKAQLEDGGYFAWGNNNSESVSQVIIALTALGINPDRDKRFIKNDNRLVQKLLTFVNADGGMAHVKGQESNGMATEQGLMALIAYKRFIEGDKKLYDMTEKNIMIEKTTENDHGKEVHFADIDKVSTWAIEYIDRGIYYGLITGSSEKERILEPHRNITKAELSTIITIALFNREDSRDYPVVFEDIHSSQWFYPYVMKAWEEKLIEGKDQFLPYENVTEEELIEIIRNAIAQLKKADMEKIEFHSDVMKSIEDELIDSIEKNIEETKYITRETAFVIAVMLYEMKN